MKKLDSNYFYDPSRAFYDGGVDYLTREKHRLIVIAETAYALLVRLSFDVDETNSKLITFKKNDIELDMKLLLEFTQKFTKAKEINLGNGQYKYELNYSEEIKNLDGILLKYIDILSNKT